MRVHHNTLKKAKTFKIDLTIEDGEIVASKNGKRLASGLSGSLVLEQAIAALGMVSKSPQGRALKKVTVRKAKPVSEDEGDSDEEGEGADDDLGSDGEGPAASGSIVKPKYRKRYQPTKGTCGDELAYEMQEYLKVAENDAGEMRVDVALLRRFAQANDCWNAKYSKCNPGVARMSITNRLRAKLRKTPDYSIKWVK